MGAKKFPASIFPILRIGEYSFLQLLGVAFFLTGHSNLNSVFLHPSSIYLDKVLDVSINATLFI